MKKKDIRMLSRVLIGGGVISVILAGVGYIWTDNWLAST